MYRAFNQTEEIIILQGRHTHLQIQQLMVELHNIRKIQLSDNGFQSNHSLVGDKLHTIYWALSR